MLRGVSWLHFFYGAVAAVLIVSGLVLRRGNGSARPQEILRTS
jgi:hypothetical protein